MAELVPEPGVDAEADPVAEEEPEGDTVAVADADALAVGLVSRSQGVDVLTALDRVRLCHPAASPIFSDLDLLERLLKTM